jgi:hypothetical protein
MHGHLASIAADQIECVSALRKRVEFLLVRAAAHAAASDMVGAAAFLSDSGVACDACHAILADLF